MTPEKLAESGTESGHQRALFAKVNADLWQLYCQECGFANCAGRVIGTPEGDANAASKWDGVDRSRLAPLRWLHSIPNGGSRGDDARSRAIRGAAMKAEGVKEGVPDVFLPFPHGNFAGFYIEMKKPGGRPSKEQLEFKAYALSVGYQWKLCDNWVDAYNELIAYLT